jgi:hypothetical protein
LTFCFAVCLRYRDFSLFGWQLIIYEFSEREFFRSEIAHLWATVPGIIMRFHVVWNFYVTKIAVWQTEPNVLEIFTDKCQLLISISIRPVYMHLIVIDTYNYRICIARKGIQTYRTLENTLDLLCQHSSVVYTAEECHIIAYNVDRQFWWLLAPLNFVNKLCSIRLQFLSNGCVDNETCYGDLRQCRRACIMFCQLWVVNIAILGCILCIYVINVLHFIVWN